MTIGRTKDERYILSLSEKARQAGDPFTAIDRYKIGVSVGFNPKSVDNICKLLAQANFIKFSGKSDIYLTSQGMELIEKIQA